MDEKHLIKISKYLSKHLRHQPERLKLELAPGGWVAVETLLAACARNGFPVTRKELNEVIEHNDKKRFSLDETGTLIRANQGHSIEIDLQLEPAVPPDVLYHGTGHRSVDSILRTGLSKMARHHVHLSADVETARKVGTRRGQPVVFLVAAGKMRGAGFEFLVSANGVWLTDHVPPEFLERA